MSTMKHMSYLIYKSKTPQVELIYTFSMCHSLCSPCRCSLCSTVVVYSRMLDLLDALGTFDLSFQLKLSKIPNVKSKPKAKFLLKNQLFWT